MSTGLKIREFSRREYEEYKSWYEDEDMKKSLGYIDEEWFAYITNNKQGIELAIFQNNSLVSVIGVAYPDLEESSYVITDLAVKPSLRNQGIGTKVLKALIERFTLKPHEFWLAFVFKFNFKGQRFFERNSWVKIKEVQEGLLRYEYHHDKY